MVRGCPNEELKEVKEGKGDGAAREKGAIAVLLPSKTIIDMNKDIEDCLEILQLSWKHLLHQARVGI